MTTPVDVDISGWALQPNSPHYDGTRPANYRPSGSVVISGVPVEDEVLTATDTLADPEALGAFSYQWVNSVSGNIGVDSATYTLQVSDVGDTITVTISYTDGAAQAETKTSAATDTIIAASAGITVSGVTGTISHDNTLTIAGTNFGAKTTAAPAFWDSVDNQSAYSALSDGDAIPVGGSNPWSRNTPPDSGAMKYNDVLTPRHSNVAAHYKGIGNEGQYYLEWPADLGGIGAAPSTQLKLYISWWMKFNYDPAIGGSSQKFMRMWDSDTGLGLRQSWTEHHMTCVSVEEGTDPNCYDWSTGVCHVTPYYKQTEPANVHYSDAANDVTGWTRMEAWMDVTEDRLQTFIDLALQHNRGPTSESLVPAIKPTDYPDIGISLYRLGFDNSSQTDFPADFTCEVSEVFVDVTRARVEIGNASTWDACTVREVQVPSAWSTTSIDITCKQNTFASAATGWVYVMDEDGIYNTSGYEITFA